MNENIDLAKILKNCPTGFELYSSVYGKVKFVSIDEKYTRSWIDVITEKNIYISFTSEGKLSTKHNGECVLFPSKDQRDWSKFTAPWYKKEELIELKFKAGDIIRHKETNKGNVYKISRVNNDLYVIDGFAGGIYIKNQDQYELVSSKFDPKTLKPFDKVLVRDSNEIKWKIDFFSHYHESIHFPYKCIGNSYKYCIPYNDETKYLVGTTDKVPEYYKYWKD